jgi:hypothetical protein
LAPLKAFLFT